MQRMLLLSYPHLSLVFLEMCFCACYYLLYFLLLVNSSCISVLVLVTQLCRILCNPMDYSPPGFPVHGILQEKILECVATPFSRRSLQPKNQNLVSGLASRFFTISATSASSVQALSRVQFFASPWTEAHQASLSITNFRSLLKLMSIKSVMPSNRLILCRPLLLLPSIFPSIRIFSNESVLCIR